MDYLAAAKKSFEAGANTVAQAAALIAIAETLQRMECPPTIGGFQTHVRCRQCGLLSEDGEVHPDCCFESQIR